jgi:hypothetical protein
MHPPRIIPQGTGETCGHPEWDVKIGVTICIKWCRKCGKAYYIWSGGGPWSNTWQEIREP